MRRIKGHISFLNLTPFYIGFFAIIIQLSAFAQEKNDFTFESNLNIAISDKPSKYSEIEMLFSKFKYDSTQMRQFISKSYASGYLEGGRYGYNSIGVIYRNLSLYEKAIEAHHNARRNAQSAESKELEIISLNMLGVVYRRMDLVKPALDYHKKALDIANSFKSPTKEIKKSIAVSQNSMGNIYLVLKQYDLAIGQFSKSLAIEEQAENKLGLAINHQNIGYAKEAKGQLDEALKDYQISLSYNDQMNSEIGRVICYTADFRIDLIIIT